MANMGHNNLNSKLVLLGDMGAGKSSLVIRFVKGQFLEFQESTIGAAFFSQTVSVNNATVKFEIWDTAGQERYHSLAPMYYRGAAAAIIVYDITSSDSFARAKKWVQELQKQGNPNMVMALAGNKCDLEDKRSVTAEEARAYADENGLFFLETSAKTAVNVNDIFHEIGIYASLAERSHSASPAVIVIGGGISGIAAAHLLQHASFKVILLESQDRIGGRIHTDYSFGFPVDMGASWLHGISNENPLSPVIRRLGLTLYRTSGDDSILYDHDLESYALFDINGRQVPQSIVTEVGVTFKKILEETDKVRNGQSSDMSVKEAILIVLDKHPELRQEGLAYEVLQWYICRMEAWFAADAELISLRAWDQEQVLSGGHGLMVQGYDPVIKALSRDIDIHLNHRVTKIVNGYKKVIVTVEDGRNFVADAAILTVPLGILKAKLIEFEPKLPEWKLSAISDLGIGNENKIAMRFERVFWPNVEFLGVVANTSYACGYFLNLHKATGHPVLVYMAAGALANDLEKLPDEAATDFVMLQLKRMFPDASDPVQYLVSRWGTDPNILGCYSYDAVGNSDDIYDQLRAPVGNIFFGGEAVSVEHQGSVHGAYSAGIMAAENCDRHLMQRLGSLERIPLAACREEIVEATVPLQISRL